MSIRAITSQVSPNTLKYLLILDFEATCGDTIPKNENEIIEFPILLYNLRETEVQATFQSYVRPVRHPVLTDFCTTLTGITQEMVNSADTFPSVWLRCNEFLRKHKVFDDPTSYAFLTCGHWDLRTMLPNQLAHEGARDPSFPPPEAIFGRWINLKDVFRRHYGLKHNKGMEGMLNRLQLPLEGRHHSGIDDSKNIARIVQRMQTDGWKPAGYAMLSSIL